MAMSKKQENRIRRHKRVRAKISGTSERPRLSVFRSNKHLFIQLVNDENGKTLVSVSDFGLKVPSIPEGLKGGQKFLLAKEAGSLIAKKALEKKIKKVVFDKGEYKYHGRIKALAEGAREGGLEF